MPPKNNDRGSLQRNLNSALVVAGEAEGRLVGALLIAPDVLRIAEVRRFLASDQFAGPLWRETYQTILELSDAGKPVVLEYLVPLVAGACDLSTDDVSRRLIEALETVGNVTTAPEYGRSVVRAWQSCELRRLAISTVGRLTEPEIAVDDVIVELVRKCERIRDGFVDPDTNDFSMAETLAAFEAQPDAEVISTGIGLLDSGLRGGFRRGQFIVAGARPSVGKSALCGQIAVNMSQMGCPVMFLTLEMSRNQMTARWLQQTSLSLTDELDRELFAGMPLRVVDAGGWTIDRVEAEAKLAVARHGLSVLVIDYLGLLRPSDTRVNRVEQISDMTRRLKVLACQLDIVVLAAHQFNRQKEGRESVRPRMSDFRDSGSIEQDADCLLGLHRDLTPGQETEAWLFVMKNRTGETSDIRMRFVGSRTSFAEPHFEIPDDEH